MRSGKVKKTLTVSANIGKDVNANSTSNIQNINVSYPPIERNIELKDSETFGSGIIVNNDDTKLPTNNSSPYDNVSCVLVYEKLVEIYKNVILNDKDTIINLIDKSGYIILSLEDIITLLSILLTVQVEDIKIVIEEEEISCSMFIKQLNPVKNIDAIMIRKDNRNYNLKYEFNDVYNKMTEEFLISLSKVITN